MPARNRNILIISGIGLVLLGLVPLLLLRPSMTITVDRQFMMPSMDRIIVVLIEEEASYDEILAAVRDNPNAVNYVGPDGWTILHHAALFSRDDLIGLFIDEGIDPNTPVRARGSDFDGDVALHIAARRGSVATARELITRGADVQHPDKEDRTPLDWARRSGNDELIRYIESVMAGDR